MEGPALLLTLTVLVLLGAGLAVWVGSRRGAARLLLRAAVVFVAAWAVVVTTLLAWVISRGGATAIPALATNPFLLFEPSSAMLWLAGAVGALAVFGAAFLLSQSVGRGFLRVLRTRKLDWPEELPRPGERVRLLAFDSATPDAFSFTLLRFGRRSRPRFYREEVILLSSALEERLTPREQRAVVAHELGHVRGFDSRYLTFLRTLSRLVVWDPLVAFVSTGLTRREEFRADEDAVRWTGDPDALARALLKVVTVPPGGTDGDLGRPARRASSPGHGQVRERVDRLSAMAAGATPTREPNRDTAR